MRALFLVVAFSVPCWGATLKGVVSDSEGPLYKTRVIVTHDLSMLVSLNKKTDFNGLYHFDLNPGPYRIVVLKAGYQPQLARVLILNEHEEVKLEHLLISSTKASTLEAESRTSKIKEAYRRSNMLPLHDEGPEYLPEQLDAESTALLSGSFQQESFRDLDGQILATQHLQVIAPLSSQMSLSTDVSYRDPEGEQVRSIGGMIQGSLGSMSLALEAEDRRNTQIETSSGSAASLTAGFGDKSSGQTHLALVTNQGPALRQRQFSLSQDLSFQAGPHALTMTASGENWLDEQESFARQTAIGSSWRHNQAPWLTMATSWDSLELPNQTLSTSQVEAQARFLHLGVFDVASMVGVQHGEHDRLVQAHQVQAHFKRAEVQAEFSDRVSSASITSSEIYGHYQPQPQLPDLTEAFSTCETRSFGLSLDLAHGDTVTSRLNWRHETMEARLLYAPAANMFQESGNNREDRYSYEVEASRLGASLELASQSQVGNGNNHQQRSLTYTQRLSPFQNKDMALRLQLILQNRPELPLWWMLAEQALPAEGNWYQGRVALQF